MTSEEFPTLSPGRSTLPRDSERPPPSRAALPFDRRHLALNPSFSEMAPHMNQTFRKTASTAAASAFAAALALSGLAHAQAKPEESAQPAPRMEKKAPAKPAAPAKAAPAKKKGTPEVAALQEALKKAGEDPGPADGLMGRKTRAALRTFQKKNKLRVTGRADKPTMAKLQPFMRK